MSLKTLPLASSQEKAMAGACILISAAFLFLFFHCVSSALTSNFSDESALLALKSRISFGPNSDFMEKNWSAASSVCSWRGVICSSRHNRVTALDISNLGLTGTIPPELGNLSFLSSLDISNNSFHGNLPGELAQLRRLKLLDLRRNNFSGPIPSFFSSLQNLRFLHCSRNGFSGMIPSSLSNMSKLEELALNLNFLEGSIPGDIGGLHFLTFLNLEGNQLSGPIPPSIFNLTMLQFMALSGNDLSGNLPADIFDNLPKLQGLYLSSNDLAGQIPPSLGTCLQLQVVSLSRNEFSGNIPREIGNLTQLTILHLGGTNLEGTIPSELGNLQSLQVFGLDGDSLTGSIPETIFNISALRIFTCVGNYLSGNLPSNMGQGLQYLEEIYFGMNNLSGIIPDSISNSTNLAILDLSNNSFTGPIPNSLGNLGSLKLLNLGNNNLVVESSSSSELAILASLTKCRNLSELVIAENPLNGMIPASIGNFSTSLKIFAAERCKIMGHIPEEIGKLSGVAMLSLFDNNLTGFIPRTIGGLQSLQQLYLYNNNIEGSLPNVICNLPNLGAMGLQANQISGPVPSCIGNLTSLRNLYLASNNFSSSLPPSLWMVKNLLRFDASSNSLSGHLPPEIGNVKSITVIDLSNNKFSANIPSSIASLQNLINLSLAHNELDGLIPESFGKLVSLETLDLSQNKLTGVIPQSLEALVYLKNFNVSFNQLSGQIPNNGPFQNYTHESFAWNGALCGAPRFQVMPCPIVSPKRGKKRILLALYILVGISALVLASALCFVVMKWKRKKKDTFETVSSPATTHERISYHELEKATNGFHESSLLGIGSYSSVYKGILTDGTLVAIKVFNLKLSGAEKSFYTECEVMRNIRHRNLTKVITSCSNLERYFKALVLDYMPNGSLEKWLHSHNYFLNILQRLDIMIDVASALDYLHSGYATPVVHCDVKPSNVLLDEYMVGHVSDFGIAKLLAVEDGSTQTKTIATIGYIAPEYGLDGLVSTKCDVYSYGIMLMETFTRTKPSDDRFAGDMTLRQWIIDSFPSGIAQVVDSNLLKPEEENFDSKVQCVSSVMELALDCTTASLDARKNMQDVLPTLKKLRLQFARSCGIT